MVRGRRWSIGEMDADKGSRCKSSMGMEGVKAVPMVRIESWESLPSNGVGGPERRRWTRTSSLLTAVVVVGCVLVISLISSSSGGSSNDDSGAIGVDTGVVDSVKEATLHIVPKHVAESVGAGCLDGSPPAFYVRKGRLDRVIVHLEGGAWCRTEEECHMRGLGRLGSSKYWSEVMPSLPGMLSHDHYLNPDFYGWTVIYVPYCDGASHSSDAGTSSGPKRSGLQNLRAVFAELTEEIFVEAEPLKEVIVSGCSAGGLGAMNLVDIVNEWCYQHNVRVGAPRPHVVGLADAGWFEGMDEYFLDIEQYHHLQCPMTREALRRATASTSIISKPCVAAHRRAPLIFAPVFFAQSVFDTWQVPRVTDVSVSCGEGREPCSRTEAHDMETFGSDLFAKISNLTETSERRHGAFLTTCQTHCMTVSDSAWTSIKDTNGVSLRTAFKRWYDATKLQQWEDPSAHLYTDCAEGAKVKCNPTCSKHEGLWLEYERKMLWHCEATDDAAWNPCA